MYYMERRLYNNNINYQLGINQNMGWAVFRIWAGMRLKGARGFDYG